MYYANVYTNARHYQSSLLSGVRLWLQMTFPIVRYALFTASVQEVSELSDYLDLSWLAGCLYFICHPSQQCYCLLANATKWRLSQSPTPISYIHFAKAGVPIFLCVLHDYRQREPKSTKVISNYTYLLSVFETLSDFVTQCATVPVIEIKI